MRAVSVDDPDNAVVEERMGGEDMKTEPVGQGFKTLDNEVDEKGHSCEDC